MTTTDANWLPTRATLLSRLRDWEDEGSWRDFFELYGKLIFATALKAGLSAPEAEDVVQETVVAVAKHIKTFRYDRGRGTFKSWLLTITRNKITDRWRKAGRELPIAARSLASLDSDPGTTLLERLPDPAAVSPDEHWEREWRTSLLHAALERLKASTDARHLQIFDCLVNKHWPAEQIAEAFQVKTEQVYVIKHRIAARLKDEVGKLENDWA